MFGARLGVVRAPSWLMPILQYFGELAMWGVSFSSLSRGSCIAPPCQRGFVLPSPRARVRCGPKSRPAANSEADVGTRSFGSALLCDCRER